MSRPSHGPRVVERIEPAGLAEIIDVRSPAEFADDHVPGAVNLPVLDDAERARVGTLYVQVDPFLARKIGAALTARNIAGHLETHFADKPGGYRALLYCWRGGQRSRSMALVLTEIGFRVELLDGGYKRYRRGVIDRLYGRAPWFEAVLIDGMTGVGKTAILAGLARRGQPTLDLEALAQHRGSVFGLAAEGRQPSQKLFEGAILAGLPPAPEPGEAARAGPQVAIEAEASKVGERMLPPVLWKAMRRAPTIEITAPLEARVRYTLAAYADIAADPGRLAATLRGLTQRHGHARIGAWIALAEAGRLEELAADLMTRHYDPAYARAARRRAPPVATLRLERLDADALDAAAAQVAEMLDADARPLSAE